jgi:uncharacterized protein with FMN-binding domain
MVKRAPIVIGVTGVGLGLLFSFHTRPVHVNIVSSAGTGSSGSTAGTSPATSGPSSGSSSPTTSSGSSSPTTSSSRRSATGQLVQYQYGDVQLKVTEQGSHVTDIQVVKEDATDPRSAEINSQAIPMLQQQAMSVGSANIDGVSGATFTSEAYAQALQSALDQLK